MATYQLEAFLPLQLRRMLEAGELEGHVESFRGTCFFADVSGFTQLSEKLAGMGREGSEQLTRVLNSFYDTMVAEILRFHGDIIKFAGDAMTVFFAEPQSLDRAKACGVSMQQLIERFAAIPTPVGTCSLKMKIGMADGECIGSIVGDKETADFLFAGSIVDQSAEAEHHASAGDIISCDGGAFNLVTEAPIVEVLPEIRRISGAIESFKRFIPRDVIEKLASGGRSFANEHRRAVVLFVSFARGDGVTSYQDITWLQTFYRTCLEITRQYDGYINKIDMGDKGAKLIIVYGAPVAHENDPDRAVVTAAEISDAARKQGLVTKIGINHAFIFSGIVGSTDRCEYTVMGDGVNLSARLMTAAPDHGIMTHTRLLKNLQRPYRWQNLAPIMVKGKSEPQPIAQLIGLDEGGRALQQSAFFSARQQELEQLATLFGDKSIDGPRLMVISGDQGVGKTALTAHFLETASVTARAVVGVAHDYTRNTSYYPWKQMLKDLLAASGEAGLAPRELLSDILEATEPQLLPYVSILGNLIDQDPLDATATAVDAETRKNILWKMIRIVIENTAPQTGQILVIDNAQWMDDLSRQLLEDLLLSVEHSSPLFIVISREPWQPALPPDMVEHIHLQPFTRDETDRFSTTFLGVREMPGKVLDKLQQMSGGNPLVMAEVLRSFIDTGYIERSSEYPDLLVVNDLALTSMPETLDAMVMSRFDRLVPKFRRFLRLLAVFGEEIPGELSPALLNRSELDEDVFARTPELSAFVSRRLDSITLHFVQPYVRTVIYESVDFSTRRELHRELGTICRDELPRDFQYRDEILAYHFSQADDAGSAIPYLDIVAKKSVRNNAFSIAVEQFERLIRFQLAIKQEKEAAANRCTLAELLIKLGDYDAAREILEQLRLTRDLEPEQLALVYFMLGDINQFRGQFEDAISAYELTISITQDRIVELKAARSIGTIFARQGNLARAETHLQSLVKEFESFKHLSDYATVQMNLGMVLFYSGKSSMQLFKHALITFRHQSDIFNELKLLNNLGQLEERKGNYKNAFKNFREAIDKANTFGFHQLLFIALSNLGVTFFRLMKIDMARLQYEKAYSYATRFNHDPSYLLMIQSNIAEMKSYLADYDSSFSIYSQIRKVILDQQVPNKSVLADYGLFYYRIGNTPGLSSLLSDFDIEETHGRFPIFVAALKFFRAIILQDHNRLSHLIDCQIYAMEQDIPIFAFYSTYEITLYDIAIDLANARNHFKKLISYRTLKPSMINILIDFCELRIGGSLELTKKLDRLFRNNPWPDLSWQRHLRIGEWYLRHDRKKAARRRIRVALQEFNSILENTTTELIRESLRSTPHARELFLLASQVQLDHSR